MDIQVLNHEFECIKILDTFESAIWTDRYSECGDFELVFAYDKELMQYLKDGYYLQNRESEHTMIIESTGIKSDTEDGNKITVTGRSLESILNRRIIWGRQTFSGNFQDAVEQILNENIIFPNGNGRKIDNFIFQRSDDPIITALTIEMEYTGDELYDVISNQCVEKKIGFKIVLDEENNFVFSLYAGSDRSYEQTELPYVTFSPDFDNIINSSFINSSTSYKTFTYILGEEQENGNSFRTSEVFRNQKTGLERRELFTDARDISSKDENGNALSNTQYIQKLEGRGKEELTKHDISTAFEGEVDAVNMFVYGVDFFVGDIVQIADEYGNEGRAYISELVITSTKDEQSVYPTFKTLSDEEVETT